MSTGKVSAKYLIDLHGLREALNSKSNKIRDSFVDALNSGELKVMRSASKELQDIDEDAYKDFQSVKKTSVYIKTTVADDALQATLMSRNGTNFWGAAPPPDRFLTLALCIRENLILVSAGKALRDTKKISKDCSLTAPDILSLADFAS